MAGDWIKLECTTPDKPEVYQIADSLGIAPEHVTGCLISLWIWADQQTTDGNAPGVTRTLVDRKSGVSGFADEMVKVGWLSESECGLSFPNFDRHNGKSAKSRALTAKRVAKHKKETNAEGNGQNVTQALPREEKRREEEKTIGQPRSVDRFGEFWKAYPKKVKKQEASKKWKARKLDRLADQILADIQTRQKSDRRWVDGFVPDPTTYINGSRWEDEIDTSKPGPPEKREPTRPESRELN